MSHYLPAFTRHRGRFQQAVCEEYILPKDHDVEPTCERCQAWLSKDDTETKALAEKWDHEEEERIAGRARRNDFELTDGKDWT